MANNKKRSKILGSDSLEPTIPDITEVEAMWASILAHLIIGANPYLDISTTHVLLMDGLQDGLDEEGALRLGQLIGKQARISITEDSPGGLH
jgi:hypothetical protein